MATQTLKFLLLCNMCIYKEAFKKLLYTINAIAIDNRIDWIVQKIRILTLPNKNVSTQCPAFDFIMACASSCENKTKLSS